jgi:hypothetical protein
MLALQKHQSPSSPLQNDDGKRCAIQLIASTRWIHKSWLGHLSLGLLLNELCREYLFISVWQAYRPLQACACYPQLVHMHRTMMSIPFQMGVIPPRWNNIVDIMLQQEVGNSRCHRLRIIALFKTDLN